MLNIDHHTALDIAIRLVACGGMIASFEQLAIKRQFSLNGVFSREVVLPFYKAQSVLRAIDSLLDVIILLQIIASVVLIVTGAFSILGRTMLFVCLLTSFLIRWRRQIGGDGAEQMNMITLIAATLALLPYPSKERLAFAVIFIAAQANLSYLTAGVAKLSSPLWRSGKALPAILSTFSHGEQRAASFLSNHSNIALLMSWGVIIFECLFPVMMFGPESLLLAALLIGTFFHLSCAVLMGLNSFPWSFLATYPCIIALHS